MSNWRSQTPLKLDNLRSLQPPTEQFSVGDLADRFYKSRYGNGIKGGNQSPGKLRVEKEEHYFNAKKYQFP
jgi:hypothetical protein